MRHIQSQSGRSMLEMLGVLAIVGVLSVGAMSGYSMAMLNYNANQVIAEIRTDIFEIKDLYADGKKYDGLSRVLLENAGVFDKLDDGGDAINVLGSRVGVTELVDGSNHYIRYYTYINDKALCDKIVLAGWCDELNGELSEIVLYNGLTVTSVRCPITPTLAATKCEHFETGTTMEIIFLTK